MSHFMKKCAKTANYVMCPSVSACLPASVCPPLPVCVSVCLLHRSPSCAARARARCRRERSRVSCIKEANTHRMGILHARTHTRAHAHPHKRAHVPLLWARLSFSSRRLPASLLFCSRLLFFLSRSLPRSLARSLARSPSLSLPLLLSLSVGPTQWCRAARLATVYWTGLGPLPRSARARAECKQRLSGLGLARCPAPRARCKAKNGVATRAAAFWIGLGPLSRPTRAARQNPSRLHGNAGSGILDWARPAARQKSNKTLLRNKTRNKTSGPKSGFVPLPLRPFSVPF